MSVKLKGNADVVAEVDANTRALRTVMRHPDIASNGAFRLSAQSGLITGIAAGTGSAGHLFCARWTHASKLAVITRFRARWRTIAGFTAGQEVGMDLFVARSYSADHAGGTAITLSTNNKKRQAHASTQFGSMRIASTTALTGSSFTLDANPIAQNQFSELAAGAAVPKGLFDLDVLTDEIASHPIVLATNGGLVLRNQILMGAGGTARVSIEMDWLEVDDYAG